MKLRPNWPVIFGYAALLVLFVVLGLTAGHGSRVTVLAAVAALAGYVIGYTQAVVSSRRGGGSRER